MSELSHRVKGVPAQTEALQERNLPESVTVSKALRCVHGSIVGGSKRAVVGAGSLCLSVLFVCWSHTNLHRLSSPLLFEVMCL